KKKTMWPASSIPASPRTKVSFDTCQPEAAVHGKWGHSSAGRAPAWHAGGQRFDPAWLHHPSPLRGFGWRATILLRRRVVSPEAHLREGGRVKRSRLRVASHNLIAAKGGGGVKTGDALRLSSSKSHRSKTNLCRFHPR